MKRTLKSDILAIVTSEAFLLLGLLIGGWGGVFG